MSSLACPRTISESGVYFCHFNLYVETENTSIKSELSRASLSDQINEQEFSHLKRGRDPSLFKP